MAYGAQLAFFLRMEAAGETVPDLDSRVEPAEHLLFEWTAFHALSSDRQIGMGVGPIPWSAIDRYAMRFGIDEADAFARFARIITAMDGAYLKDVAERREREHKP